MSERSVVSQRSVPTSVAAASDGDGRYRVVINGDIDEDFGREIVRFTTDLCARKLVAHVRLDLSEVVVFGSAGLRVLEDVSELAAAGGFGFDVDASSATTRQAMSMFDLDHLLAATSDTVDSVADGLISSDAFAHVVAHGVLNGRDAVVVTTPGLEQPDPRILFVNRAFTDLFGYAADEVIGHSPRMLQGPLTDRSVLARMKEHYRRGEPFEDDLINYTAHGTPFVMSWKVIPVPAQPGQAAYAMSMQRDVTSERRRRRFDMANDLLDTQLRIGDITLDDPTVPIKQTMTTLLAVQSLMLGAGVATVVLTDRRDRDHMFSTAMTDADIAGVDSVLGLYGRDPIETADLDLDSSTAHLRIDSLTVPRSLYRCARLVLSGVHRDWLRLAHIEYHERLLQRVFSHNP